MLFKRRNSSGAEYFDVYFRRDKVAPDGLLFKKGEGEIKDVRRGGGRCLESSTSFSTFEDKEGKIRIWYTADGEKAPILIELELPIGHIKFELESVEKS